MFLKIKWTSNLSTRSIFTLSLCDCVWAAIVTDRLAGAKWVAAFSPLRSRLGGWTHSPCVSFAFCHVSLKQDLLESRLASNYKTGFEFLILFPLPLKCWDTLVHCQAWLCPCHFILTSLKWRDLVVQNVGYTEIFYLPSLFSPSTFMNNILPSSTLNKSLMFLLEFLEMSWHFLLLRNKTQVSQS